MKNTFILFRPYLSRESILSISATDFSFAYNPSRQLVVAAQDAPAVISSEIWGDEEGAAELIKIAEERLPIRVQISVGAEFQKYENRLRAFLDLGGACDLLFDRPLAKDLQQKLLPLANGFDFRLCFVVSRYFDVSAVIDSLSPELKNCLFLLFFPPESKDSCYLSNDEVVRVLNTLDPKQVWNALILSNVVEHCLSSQDRHFFANLDTEVYYSVPHLLKGYSFFRNTVGWMARRKFIFLLDLLYSAMIFLKDPRNFIRYRTWVALKHNIHMAGIFVWYRVLKPLPQFLRYRVWSALRHGAHMGFVFLWYRVLKPLPQFLRYRVWSTLRHGVHMGFVFLWYRVLKPFPQFIRYNVVPPVYKFIRYQILHRFVVLCRYTALPWLHIFVRYRIPSLMRILFYPVLKIYWFISYQIESRVLPLFKSESKDP